MRECCGLGVNARMIFVVSCVVGGLAFIVCRL